MKDPILKNPKHETVVTKTGAPRNIVKGFLMPPPDAPKGYVCPAGPGRGPVPKDGRWYQMNHFLWRRLRDGDLVEGMPQNEKPRPEKKPAVKKSNDEEKIR